MPQLRPFTDDDGHPWSLSITWDQQEHLKASFGLDILTIDAHEAAALLELIDNPPRLTKVIASLCESQLRTANVTPDEFRNRLRNDGLLNAVNAFVLAVSDFFPTKRRAMFLAFWNGTLRVAELVDQQADKLLQTMPAADTLAFEVIVKEVLTPEVIEKELPPEATDEQRATKTTELRAELAETLGLPSSVLSTTSPVASA